MVKIDLSVTVPPADYVSQPGVRVLGNCLLTRFPMGIFWWCLTACLKLCESLLPDKLLQWEKDILLFSVDECWYSYETEPV